MPKKQKDKLNILVSGDVVVDNHLYLGERKTPDTGGRGVKSIHEWGGAKLAEGILTELASLKDSPFPAMDVSFGLRLQQRPCLYSGKQGQARPDARPNLHCYATWTPAPFDKPKQVWRVKDAQGYGGEGGAFYDFAPARLDGMDPPDVLVLEDAALGFRFKLDGNPETGAEYVRTRGQNKHFAWPALLEERPKGAPAWVVLKMSRPLCKGDLWTTLTKPANKKRLVVVASINDIRRGPVQISRGCSWERTATDLVRELLQNPALQPLLQCQHLVIPMQSEGALWVENASSEQRVFHLTLDPVYQEGEWQETKGSGRVLGYLSCMTASIAAHLADVTGNDEIVKTFEQGIRRGLGAMRRLFEVGHGTVGDPSPGFPFKEVAMHIATGDCRDYGVVTVPRDMALSAADADTWSLLADAEFEKMKLNWPLIGVARRVAMFGPNQLQGAPHVRYGHFLTADRGEIEALQNLRRIIAQYKENPNQKQPLNIAVFGPPGAGKSFAVKQLAKKMLDKHCTTITFNLSQFDSQEDLVDAFHQVRDAVLKGSIPLIFWDEFDADNLRWLKSFLAPMQDGEFTEGQCTHSIGRCIFVFAGGTRESMEAFITRGGSSATWDGRTEADDFIAKKGPDFVSRLSGYLNVRGPNPQLISVAAGGQHQDVCYPVRRATMVRGMLGLDDAKCLLIDRDVLTAILAVGKYKNGSRSLEKLVKYLADAANGPIAPSHLPPRDILAMLVEDVDEFMGFLGQSVSFTARAAVLAPEIHHAYLRSVKKGGDKPNWDLDFDQLPEHIKQDNIAAAGRIIDLLAMVGLTVAPATPANRRKRVPDEVVSTLLERHKDTMARLEHDGWVAQKRTTGYQYDQDRDEPRRRHHSMEDYDSLSDNDKNKDIDSVLEMPSRVRDARHVIVPLL